MKKLSFVVMDLSGIYERESFWREREGALLLSLRDRFQRGGLRAPEEAALLRAELLRPELLSAPLHFLDLSDYHYMSRFWLEQREEDFLLVIYDYDADLRRTEQRGISHASWIREIMLRMPHCRGILLLGPSAEKRARINDELMSLGREYRPSPELRDPILSTSLYCFTDEDLRNGRAESHIPSLLQLLSLPLCLSIDFFRARRAAFVWKSTRGASPGFLPLLFRSSLWTSAVSRSRRPRRSSSSGKMRETGNLWMTGRNFSGDRRA